MKLHVANLPLTVTERELRGLFAQFGKVSVLEVDCTRQKWRLAGTAVVEMERSKAQAALRLLNGKAFRCRRLYITPLPDRVPEAARAVQAGQGG